MIKLYKSLPDLQVKAIGFGHGRFFTIVTIDEKGEDLSWTEYWSEQDRRQLRQYESGVFVDCS